MAEKATKPRKTVTTARNRKNEHNCKILFEFGNNLQFIVFDTETTGLKAKRDYIVELAAKKYKVVGGVMQEIDCIDLYIRPPIKMTGDVIAVHGITNEFLEDKPSEKECMPEIEAFFGSSPVLLGYNVDFDIGMLTELYKRQRKELIFTIALDVAEMARDLVPRKDMVDYLVSCGLVKKGTTVDKPYRLGNVVKYFGADKGLTFHNALDDTEATARLLGICYLEYKAKTRPERLTRLYVEAFKFWDAFGLTTKGIWVQTHHGYKLYYSPYYKEWRSSDLDLQTVDIDALEKYLADCLGITTKELLKLTKKRFDDLLSLKRLEGVNIRTWFTSAQA